jgi:hypothetical protein
MRFSRSGASVRRIRHGQFVPVAVIDIASDRRDLDAPLLLPGGPLREIAVMNELKPDQAAANGKEP